MIKMKVIKYWKNNYLFLKNLWIIIFIYCFFNFGLSLLSLFFWNEIKGYIIKIKVINYYWIWLFMGLDGVYY